MIDREITEKWKPKGVWDEDYLIKPRTNEFWSNRPYYVVDEEEKQVREGLTEPAGFSDDY